MQDAVERLRLSKVAASEPVLAFWKEHGRDWALHEGDHADVARVAAIAKRVAGKSDAVAAGEVSAEFREIWRAGFSDREEAYGWNEMGDGLPDAALLAFARGAAEAFAEVESKV